MISILLVDDLPSMRQLLRIILLNHPDLQVVGEAENGRSAIQLALLMRPDVTVMDIAMPELDGLTATKLLVSEQPEIRILIHSIHSSRSMVEEAFRAGARGYLMKDDTAGELADAIRTVAAGGTYRSSSVAR